MSNKRQLLCLETMLLTERLSSLVAWVWVRDPTQMLMRTEKRRRLGLNHHSIRLLHSPEPLFPQLHARRHPKQRLSRRSPFLHQSRPQDYPLLLKTSLLYPNRPQTHLHPRPCRTRDPNQINPTTSSPDMVSQASSRKPLPHLKSRTTHSANRSRNQTTRRPLATTTLLNKAKHHPSPVPSRLPLTTTPHISPLNNVRNTRTTMVATVSLSHKPSKKLVPRNSVLAALSVLDLLTQPMLRVSFHR